MSTSRLIAYAVLVFITSALVLVIELVAARLIAPFVGVSLYSWTAIIGVILAGLSIGNWIGGAWADRGGSEKAVGLCLVLAGLSAFAILLLLPLIAGPLQRAELSLASTSLILTGSLFFLPAALLGVITPLLTTLAVLGHKRPGHIIGLMHALAALGSILGTFATGFWLIQWLGSRQLILATGILLLVMAIPLFRRAGPVTAVVLLGSAVGYLTEAEGYADPCDRETNYFCIRVVDSSADAPFGEARSMVLDHLLHSTNHLEEPRLIIAPYLHLMDELIYRQTKGKPGGHYFFAGGGAYTLPRAMKFRDAEAELVVAELDPVVTEMAVDSLYLDTRGMDIKHLDARVALARQPKGHFDAVIGDVFHDVAIPYHLLTQEFAVEIRDHLKPEGIYVMNVVDAFPDAQLVKSLHKTLSHAFEDVSIWIDELPTEPTRLTFIVSARNGGPKIRQRVFSRNGYQRVWFNVTDEVLKTGKPLAEIPALSDEFAPVERLLSRLFLGKEGL